MHLFLTSSPCNDDVPEGVELPCIFNEENGFVVNLCDRVPQNAHLLVVAADPLAFDQNDEMADTFAGCFEYHGMQLTSVDICDARTENWTEDLVYGSDVIILGGGHVPTENAFFRRIGLRDLLEDYEGVVIGISAGSMNCASIVYAQPELPGEAVDPAYQRYLSGLGLTDIMVLPHYQKVKDVIIDGMRLYEDVTYGDSYDNAFLAIVDGSYVLVENGTSVLFGEGYCIENGEIEQICAEGCAVEL